MQSHYVRRVYDFYSDFYDFVFAPFFLAPLKKAMKHLKFPPGARLLDIGVGTGATLGYVPEDAWVVAIDLSEDMLKRAKKKFPKDRFCVMDALNLGFQDDSFHIAVAAFVLTVVPDPQRMLDEMERVVKPGGQILIINHFMSRYTPIAIAERALDPVCRKIGWRMDVPLEIVTSRKSLQIEYVVQKKPWIFWKGVVAKVKK